MQDSYEIWFDESDNSYLLIKPTNIGYEFLTANAEKVAEFTAATSKEAKDKYDDFIIAHADVKVERNDLDQAKKA